MAGRPVVDESVVDPGTAESLLLDEVGDDFLVLGSVDSARKEGDVFEPRTDRTPEFYRLASTVS